MAYEVHYFIDSSSSRLKVVDEWRWQSGLNGVSDDPIVEDTQGILGLDLMAEAALDLIGCGATSTATSGVVGGAAAMMSRFASVTEE